MGDIISNVKKIHPIKRTASECTNLIIITIYKHHNIVSPSSAVLVSVVYGKTLVVHRQ